MALNRGLGTPRTAVLAIVTTLVLVPAMWGQAKYRSLYRFTNGKDGASPVAGLIFDQAGNLYGTAWGGGAYQYGVVFRLTPNSDGRWTEKVLHSFTGREDGGNPQAGLVFDRAGNLYGTTTQGGAHHCDCGVVFELTQNADGKWKEKVLHSFTGGDSDGAAPTDRPIFDSSGNLYGTASNGGNNDFGVVFKLTPNSDGSWTETVIHYFASGNDGAYPRSGLIPDEAGNLYGTTSYGGTYGGGTVFKMKPHSDGTWTESVLYAFQNEGESPVAGLIFDSAGNLYGTTPVLIGGEGFGIAFELTPNSDGTWTERVLYRFCSLTRCPDGSYPGGLIFDRAGNLYGTANGGGDGGYGVVFKLTPRKDGGWEETVVHAFLDHPGADPHVGMILDTTGNLYGTTAGDGGYTFGSVFEFTP
ncbi:MAG TPA: choice-of-anchor tandem repeat GloVer-containing protein [Terriglobales bacterium]|nr:choice-of-anchor tandem repeat GloVer-containing protein [Terriglobales bacterium]